MRFMKLYLLTMLTFSQGMALASEEEDLALLFGDEDFVSIATGRKQLISRAPAVATVITAQDIKAINAQDLDDILETIPGLHVSYNSKAYNPIYIMRGIYSSDNPQVLLLINGIPLTNVYIGDRSQVWGGMPVENISRIEVIRGPGSAVYGADAYAGTINIITKTASEIGGVQVGGAVGSFDSTRGWLLYGDSIADWNVAFSMELFDTAGQDETVGVDQQSLLDQFFGTSASYAPGSVNTGRKSMDMRLDVSQGFWQARLGYQGRRDVGLGAGVNQALDPNGEGESTRINADLTYHNTRFSEHWDVKAQLSFFQTGFKTNIFLLPPGADFSPIGGGSFPEGVIGNPSAHERHSRIDLSAFFTGIEDHDIRIGTGYYYQNLYEVEETKNFELVVDPIFGPVIVSLGQLVDVSSTMPFIEERTREVSFLFLQDEWSFARDWSFTAGVRYDHYSDFGGTVNPRLALVWQTNYNLTTKLLYSRAFRAPSFAEQFNINNPVAIGNDDLDPEIINTYELAFDYSPHIDLHLGLNIFYYKMEDIIRFAPTVAQNTGTQTGTGMEVEFKWDIRKGFRLQGNYAFQDSEDEDTNSDAPNAPRHQFYLRSRYDLNDRWAFNAQLNHVMDRKRALGDNRSEIDDYTTLDLILRGTHLPLGVELAFVVRNATDADVREPSLAPGSIPGDLPLAGRSFQAEIRKSW